MSNSARPPEQNSADAGGDDRSAMARAYSRASLGFELAIGLVGPPILGAIADHWLQSNPVGVLVGATLGLMLSIARMFALRAPPGRPGHYRKIDVNDEGRPIEPWDPSDPRQP